MSDLTNHWNKVYTTKQLNEVSWYQPIPETSLSLIEQYNIDSEAKVIDIGGGDSFLMDNLLEKGFKNLSVLDISQSALDRAIERLGEKSSEIQWICSDVNDFNPSKKYDLWHDRAAFHFLTNPDNIKRYVHLVGKSIDQNGLMILGTFSENGPKKCSGLEISQYSENDMRELFSEDFNLEKSFCEDHDTPFGTTQNFTFGVFRRK